MDSILSMEMLLSTLRMAIPLVLASVGGTLCERSGIINLGIEGMMLSGAFGAVYGTYISGNPWIGVLFAILVGGLFGIFALRQINPSAESGSTYLFPDLRLFLPGQSGNQME